MRRLAPLIICLFIMTGCNSALESSARPTPTPTPKPPLETALEAELEDGSGETEEGRVLIRRAAVDYVASTLPGANVEGTSIEKCRHNVYLVLVDLSKNGQRQIEGLVVKLYVADGGKLYWKAEPYASYLKYGVTNSLLTKTPGDEP